MYLAFHPDDWLSGTATLNVRQKGALITIVALTGAEGRPPCNEPKFLAMRFGCRKAEAVKLISELIDLGKLEEVDGRLVSRRAVLELETSQKRKEVKRKAAQKRWKSEEKEGQSETKVNAK